MPSTRGTLAIVVPCYNEAQRLPVELFQQFAAGRPELRFLFVDDGSTDDTLAVLKQLRASNPAAFDVLPLPCNGGKAEAVRQGMLAALATSAEYVGYWDADLATPLAAIDALADVLRRRADIEIVFGARLPLLGHRICRTPWRRRLGSTFALAASTLLGFRIRDTQCGAKLFRASSLAQWIFDQPFHSRWIFDVEILARLVFAERRFGLPRVQQTLYEQPLDAWEDIAGSKLKSSDFRRALTEMSAIYWTWLRPHAPGICPEHSQTLPDRSHPIAIPPTPTTAPRRSRAA
jgi:glycosyltransferase involved in cell wall biosynthesis